MGIKAFQQDLKDGMKLETTLKKHGFSLKDAVEMCLKTYVHRKPTQKPSTRKNVYKKVDTNIVYVRSKASHVRKNQDGKYHWGGAYDTLEEAQKMRDFLNKEGWNPVKLIEGCKKFGITRRTR
ncbi:MAG: hypothetical protein IJF83_10835 [Methanobrevibacter sp.]|nr:hypothetical protein [Methanobrevibacter sp.]